MTANISLLNVFIILVLAACNGTIAIVYDGFPVIVPERTQNLKSDCNTEPTYSYEYSQTGHYRSYKTVIRSQIPFQEHHFSAAEISQLGHFIHEEAEKKFKLEASESWRWEALKLMLQETHVILVEDDAHLKQIMGDGDWGDTQLLAQTSRSIWTCFQPVNSTWYYVIVNKSFKRTDSDTVVHEAMHIVSRVLFDDYQHDHDNPLFWDENGQDSLQEAVKDRWNMERVLSHVHNRLGFISYE